MTNPACSAAPASTHKVTDLLSIGPPLTRRGQRQEFLFHHQLAGDGIHIGLDFILAGVSPTGFLAARTRHNLNKINSLMIQSLPMANIDLQRLTTSVDYIDHDRRTA